jgi:hypothetical protein
VDMAVVLSVPWVCGRLVSHAGTRRLTKKDARSEGRTHDLRIG